jgi:hypothetical protein
MGRHSIPVEPDSTLPIAEDPVTSAPTRPGRHAAPGRVAPAANGTVPAAGDDGPAAPGQPLQGAPTIATPQVRIRPAADKPPAVAPPSPPAPSPIATARPTTITRPSPTLTARPATARPLTTARSTPAPAPLAQAVPDRPAAKPSTSAITEILVWSAFAIAVSWGVVIASGQGQRTATAWALGLGGLVLTALAVVGATHRRRPEAGDRLRRPPAE